LDRSRETPLTALCPIDVMRNTLGVGPCQYILDVEGLPSEGNPTPDAVMAWVERQFERGKERQAADEIRSRLASVIEHAMCAEGRIRRYLACAREVAPRDSREVPADVRSLCVTVKELETAAAGEPSDLKRLAELTETVTSLIGKPNAAAACRAAGGEMRRIGAAQDRALSKCRMLARWLVQQCRMWAARDPAAAERANAIRARVEKVLQGK